MTGAAGRNPKHPSSPSIRVNITVTLHTLNSLALVSENTRRVYVLLGPAGRIAICLRPFFFFFCLLSIGGPANLYESVATECLSAGECGAPQQPSPHPPTCSLVRCLPATPPPPHKTGFPFSSSLPPLGLQAQSSSFRTGPPVLNLLLLRQSLSSTTSNSSLSSARITLARDGCI